MEETKQTSLPAKLFQLPDIPKRKIFSQLVDEWQKKFDLEFVSSEFRDNLLDYSWEGMRGIKIVHSQFEEQNAVVIGRPKALINGRGSTTLAFRVPIYYVIEEILPALLERMPQLTCFIFKAHGQGPLAQSLELVFPYLFNGDGKFSQLKYLELDFRPTTQATNDGVASVIKEAGDNLQWLKCKWMPKNALQMLKETPNVKYLNANFGYMASPKEDLTKCIAGLPLKSLILGVYVNDKILPSFFNALSGLGSQLIRLSLPNFNYTQAEKLFALAIEHKPWSLQKLRHLWMSSEHLVREDGTLSSSVFHAFPTLEWLSLPRFRGDDWAQSMADLIRGYFIAQLPVGVLGDPSSEVGKSSQTSRTPNVVIHFTSSQVVDLHELAELGAFNTETHNCCELKHLTNDSVIFSQAYVDEIDQRFNFCPTKDQVLQFYSQGRTVTLINRKCYGRLVWNPDVN